MDDVVASRKPEYSYEQRSRHHTGSGVLRLTLDLKTGSVTNVVVIQSTRVPALDRSAIEAFRHWRWKPGKW
ncbi:MAG: energy transducer TonB, partial [Chthoniobacterales bacterium]